MARVQALVEARSPTQRDADRRLFLNGLGNDLMRAEFARLGWYSALCTAQMITLWEEMVPGAFDELLENLPQR